MTYRQACDQLPPDAVWRSSFGLPGFGRFLENYATGDGGRWQIGRDSEYDEFWVSQVERGE